MGPTVASLTTTPQSLRIEMVVDINPSATQLITQLTVANANPLLKTTALTARPTSFVVRCGILNSPQEAKDAGSAPERYTVKIDDVKFQLCRRKP